MQTLEANSNGTANVFSSTAHTTLGAKTVLRDDASKRLL